MSLYSIREFGAPAHILGVFFNDFIKYSLINDIRKRIIINQETGSSWQYNRYDFCFSDSKYRGRSKKDFEEIPIDIEVDFFKKMSHFIIKEAADADAQEEEEEEEQSNDQESNFVDDRSVFSEQGPSDYRKMTSALNFLQPFKNVTRSFKEAMKIAYELHKLEMENCSDGFSNFVFGSEPENSDDDDFDEYSGWEKRIKEFEQTLKQKCQNTTHSFFNAVLWDTYFKLKGKNATFDDGDLNECLGTEFLQTLKELKELKENIILDVNLDTFERKMHSVNDLLYEKNLFLRLYEKKKKIKYVFEKGHDKNEVLQQVSSCVAQRFNGFHITRQKQKTDFEPLDIIYKPVKRLDEILECYFKSAIPLAFSAKDCNVRYNRTAYQCHYCNDFIIGKPCAEKHLRVRAKRTGIVYKFNNQHLTTFEDNFKLMGDQPFSVYFDLETTCGKTKLLIWKIKQLIRMLFRIVLL